MTAITIALFLVAADEPTAVEKDVIAHVNVARKAADLNPVTADPILTKHMREYAAALAEKGELSHTLGGKVGERATAAGYKWSNVGENVAAGQDDAKEVVEAWMNSEGHKANILNPKFVHIGVGTVVAADGIRYWSQMFAAPKGQK